MKMGFERDNRDNLFRLEEILSDDNIDINELQEIADMASETKEGVSLVLNAILEKGFPTKNEQQYNIFSNIYYQIRGQKLPTWGEIFKKVKEKTYLVGINEGHLFYGMIISEGKIEFRYETPFSDKDTFVMDINSNGEITSGKWVENSVNFGDVSDGSTLSFWERGITELIDEDGKSGKNISFIDSKFEDSLENALKLELESFNSSMQHIVENSDAAFSDTRKLFSDYYQKIQQNQIPEISPIDTRIDLNNQLISDIYSTLTKLFSTVLDYNRIKKDDKNYILSNLDIYDEQSVRLFLDTYKSTIDQNLINRLYEYAISLAILTENISQLNALLEGQKKQIQELKQKAQEADQKAKDLSKGNLLNNVLGLLGEAIKSKGHTIIANNGNTNNNNNNNNNEVNLDIDCLGIAGDDINNSGQICSPVNGVKEENNKAEAVVEENNKAEAVVEENNKAEELTCSVETEKAFENNINLLFTNDDIKGILMLLSHCDLSVTSNLSEASENLVATYIKNANIVFDFDEGFGLISTTGSYNYLDPKNIKYISFEEQENGSVKLIITHNNDEGNEENIEITIPANLESKDFTVPDSIDINQFYNDLGIKTVNIVNMKTHKQNGGKDTNEYAGSFIWAIKDLQDQIKEDPSYKKLEKQNGGKALDGFEWIQESAEKLAIQWGAYLPKEKNESIVVYEGDKLELINGEIKFIGRNKKFVLFNANVKTNNTLKDGDYTYMQSNRK